MTRDRALYLQAEIHESLRRLRVTPYKDSLEQAKRMSYEKGRLDIINEILSDFQEREFYNEQFAQ